MKQVIIPITCIAFIILAGCGSAKTVERIEVDTTIDLSGRWNDTDSRQSLRGNDCGLSQSPVDLTAHRRS